jgi:glycosyltransferase involved in cell wall biosynthesis
VIDGSTDKSEELLSVFKKSNSTQKIKVIKNSSNLGISQSRNVGIAASQSQILAFLDDDCRPTPHWINDLGELWNDASPSTMGIGGFVIPSEIKSFNQRFCAVTMPLRPYPMNAKKMTFVRRVKKYYAKPQENFMLVDYLVGANMSFRKTALDEVECFPSEIRFGGDDSYICHSLSKKYGDACLTVVPSLVMPHEFPQSFSDSLRRSYKYGLGAGKNFLRGSGGLSFNPGPLLILSLFLISLAIYTLSGGSVKNLPWISSLLPVIIIFFYSLLVTGGHASDRLRLFERPKFGLAFLLCECANTLGFFSASIVGIKKLWRSS